MSSLVLIPLIILLLVFATSVIQRVSGSGFGLVLAPFLVLLIGAHEGVMLSNFLSIFAPLFVMWRTWRLIEWRRLIWLALPCLLIMPPAAWLSVRAHEGYLYLGVGLMVIFGLAVSLVIHRINMRIDGPVTRLATGGAVGAGTVLVGVGAPPIAIYTVLSGWRIQSMIATIQPLWLVAATTSFCTKLALDDGQLPTLPWWAWAGTVVMIIAGMYFGEWVQRHMDENGMRRVVTVIALLGGLLALGMGIRSLFLGG